MASSDQYLSTVVKETYRIDEVIGQGGMGVVYLATHLRLGSKVVVKFLLADLAKHDEAVVRFRREAKVAMDLRDENIVHIHDYDLTPEGTPFIVMEYLEGEDLASLIKREAPLHLDRTMELAVQICAALSAAHRQKVVHRDLKPANIFLKRRTGSEPVVKILDFGIARIMDSRSVITRTGALLGTPCFMSPEQAKQQRADLDGRSDIFSFGCILYYMLSGQQPFSGDTFASVLLRVVSGNPAPLRSLVPQLPEQVAGVVQKSMSKARDKRYQTIDSMMFALCRATGDGEWGATSKYLDTVVTAERARGEASQQPVEESWVFAATEDGTVSTEEDLQGPVDTEGPTVPVAPPTPAEVTATLPPATAPRLAPTEEPDEDPMDDCPTERLEEVLGSLRASRESAARDTGEGPEPQSAAGPRAAAPALQPAPKPPVQDPLSTRPRRSSGVLMGVAGLLGLVVAAGVLVAHWTPAPPALHSRDEGKSEVHTIPATVPAKVAPVPAKSVPAPEESASVPADPGSVAAKPAPTLARSSPTAGPRRRRGKRKPRAPHAASSPDASVSAPHTAPPSPDPAASRSRATPAPGPGTSGTGKAEQRVHVHDCQGKSCHCTGEGCKCSSKGCQCEGKKCRCTGKGCLSVGDGLIGF